MKSTMIRFAFAAGAALAAVLSASPGFAGPVTTEDLVKAQDNAGEWLMYGRDYRNWRYSPLAEITPGNAAKLTSSSPIRAAHGSTFPPRSTPNPATSSGTTSPNTRKASTPCCAAAPSIADWR
jgi:hypothetical protein